MRGINIIFSADDPQLFIITQTDRSGVLRSVLLCGFVTGINVIFSKDNMRQKRHR